MNIAKEYYKDIDNDFKNDDRQQENFEKVVMLLEETAMKVDFFRKDREREKNKTLIGIMIIYGLVVVLMTLELKVLRVYFEIGIMFSSLLLILFMFNQINKLKLLRDQLTEERKVLEKLIYLTHEYKENIRVYNSTLVMTLLEIRIQRVEFIFERTELRFRGRLLKIFFN